ncbi:YggS family pyridoxal phosphate enzyme [Arthrobacter polaris]|uniref:YggS family pyridoxal phosphate enzyme n=1 Tax=Arthrobacter polaris TaxID=2813727 RepID=UPI001F1AE947|nr:YggS family pyridoxal phosphate enzyme [Arthrobacter polaris]UIK89674.1 YggS family pyridoxal phosphate enzyme [Arthrobacter polaris]
MTLYDSRSTILAQRLAAVRHRIEAAVRPASPGGLAAAEPTLIVVTKFHPSSDVLRLRSLGVSDVGENRDQEAAAKALEVADMALRWHFIGQLQTNKAKSVAAYAHSVHSIDRASLVKALGRAVAAQQQENGRANLECFIQVDLSEAYTHLAEAEPAGHGGRGGVAPSNIGALAELISGTEGLDLAGVMAVAPLGVTPEPAFNLLASLSAALLADYPGATGISAGMSHDLEAALAVGATHLRVGSDILGPRPAVL